MSPSPKKGPVARKQQRTPSRGPARVTSARSRSASTSNGRKSVVPAAEEAAATEKLPLPSSTKATDSNRAAASKKSGGKHAEYEFGGPLGALFTILFSHALLYWVFYCLQHNGGQLAVASSWQGLLGAVNQLRVSAAPTLYAAALYFGFLAFETLLALTAPGLVMKGRPGPNGQQLTYNCNAYLGWWITLAVIAALHYANIFKMSEFIQHQGSIMSVAVLFADAQSLGWYLYAHATGQTHHLSGNVIYDFFMGAILHPRLFGGRLDVKLFAEIRVSWTLLFVLTLSCAVQKFEEIHSVPTGMLLLVFAHFLYANATAKGEHYVVPTWDITYEKYGWMLCFWNFAGVPFLYSKSAVYLLRYGTAATMPSNAVIAALAFLYCAAYYVWDTSQSQKNHFRLSTVGTVIDRRTFPYLPWSKLDHPRFLPTKLGTPLLVDGWWRYARKIHYTMDVLMALIWALSTGGGSPLPFIYPAFFTVMILHRYTRDVAKCARNYGADWDEYLRIVPYAFIPGVF